MKITILSPDKARLSTAAGKIRDKYTGREYSEVYCDPLRIYRYEDSDPVEYEPITTDDIPAEVKVAFDQVVQLIMKTASDYNAVEDLKALPNISIASLFGLASEKGVPPAEVQSLITQVVLLKTDIEAKYSKSWYAIWNGDLKPYIVEKLTAAA